MRAAAALLLLLAWAGRAMGQAGDSLPPARPLWVPALALGAAGAAVHASGARQGVERWRQAHGPTGHIPGAEAVNIGLLSAPYLLDWCGVPARTDAMNRGVLAVKSAVLMAAMVYPAKRLLGVERPNGGAHAMPSGHTARAFVAAGLLHQEMGHRKGIAAAGYVLAAAVGASRVANGEHWASDVLAGAGAGLLAVHIAYATHQYRWKLPRWAPRWLEGPQVRAGLVPAPGGIGLRLQW